MHAKPYRWLGREFVSLSAEGRDGTPEQQTRDLLGRFAEELQGHGPSLENTVRTRLWARDRDSRTQDTAERLATLSGRARSSSSSFVAPGRFATGADVALDLLALRPPVPEAAKAVVEHEPPVAPDALHYLRLPGLPVRRDRRPGRRPAERSHTLSG